MVVTLTGDNSFGLQAELQMLTLAFVKEHGDFGLERLDGEDTDFSRLQEAILGLPFLSDKKLVVLRTPSKNKQFSEKAEQILTNASELTDVIFVEPKLDKRLSYYKFLKSQTDFREFNALDQNGLVQWLVKSAQAQSGNISSADARYLVDRVGANQQLLANELDKLLLYESHITRTTIDLLTDETPQSTIFQLLEAAFAGNTRQALNLYGEQRALKVEVPQIIAMLTWQLYVLALIKTSGDRTPEQIASESKLNPYVVRKSSAVARKLTLAKLKSLIGDLLSIDTRLKREGLDPDEAILNYLVRMPLY